MDAFTRLKKNLKNDFSGLQPVRIAVLGDTSTQWLVQAIRGAGYERGFDLRILEADFNQVEREVFDASSALYAFDPQVIILRNREALCFTPSVDAIAKRSISRRRGWRHGGVDHGWFSIVENRDTAEDSL